MRGGNVVSCDKCGVRRVMKTPGLRLEIGDMLVARTWVRDVVVQVDLCARCTRELLLSLLDVMSVAERQQWTQVQFPHWERNMVEGTV